MIHFVLEGVPPTANHAYFTRAARKGKVVVPVRTLSKEGKAYKVGVKDQLGRTYPHILGFFKPNKPYSIIVRFFFKKLQNTSKEAGSRYKKMDVSNRLKLFEDALVEALGHDDSQHFRILCIKEPAARNTEEATEVFAWSWEDEDCLFDQLLEQAYGQLSR